MWRGLLIWFDHISDDYEPQQRWIDQEYTKSQFQIHLFLSVFI